MTLGDILFRQAAARRKLQGNDGPTQLTLDALSSGPLMGGKG